MIIIGVDPGLSGGIAVINQAGRVLAVTAVPLAGKELDISKLSQWVDDAIVGNTVEAYIEKVGAMPGQGVSSMFKFGFVTGVIHGIFGSMEIPRTLVTPQRWKKYVLVDTLKDKDAAVEHCSRKYPNVSLLATERSRKPHTGMADAICIAEYGLYVWHQSNK